MEQNDNVTQLHWNTCLVFKKNKIKSSCGYMWDREDISYGLINSRFLSSAGLDQCAQNVLAVYFRPWAYT